MTDQARREITIQSPEGLHGRPAAQVVKAAGEFECEITISKGPHTVNAKSIMGVLTLAAQQGENLTLQARGTNCQKAIHKLSNLLANPRLGAQFKEQANTRHRSRSTRWGNV